MEQIRNLLKAASALDKMGFYKEADKLMKQAQEAPGVMDAMAANLLRTLYDAIAVGNVTLVNHIMQSPQALYIPFNVRHFLREWTGDPTIMGPGFNAGIAPLGMDRASRALAGGMAEGGGENSRFDPSIRNRGLNYDPYSFETQRDISRVERELGPNLARGVMGYGGQLIDSII